MRRRSRSVRPPIGKYKVTERDLEILFAVGRMGQATSHQLQRLFFGDRSTALRRLAKLTAVKLLDVWVPSQDAANIYTLGAAGISALRSAGFSTAELHRSKVGRSVDLHLQALNDVRVEFVLGARQHRVVQLEGFLGDLDLRRLAGSPPPLYIPDALATLLTSAGLLVLVIEVDMGTEAVSVFKAKAELTVALWQAGAACWGATPGVWRPVVFVPGEPRARTLARGITATGGGDLWLVAELNILHERGALGEVFATASEIAAAKLGKPVEYRGALAPALTAADREGP